MSSDVVIRAEGLTKSYRVFAQSADRLKQAVTFGRRQYYKRFTALDNVSFEIRRGETVGIVGRNGSGKSTLLQLICGILKPSAGRVEVKGRISALLELGAGFHPDFTGRENVLFYATVLGMPREQIDRRLPEIEAFADIGEFMDQPVRTYSSGMFVRLAFATAIHTDPDLLVVDEALAVGDAAFQAKCQRKLDGLRSSGCTIVLVSHDLNQITSVCSRALLLDRAGLVADGEPALVTNEYRRLLAPGGLNARPAPSAPDFSKAGQALWADQFLLNPASVRYGNGRAHILEGGTFDSSGKPEQVFSRGDQFLVRLRVVYHEELAAPCALFLLKDRRGTVLCGTHSHYQQIPLPNGAPGTTLVVTFRQMLTLNPGDYLLSIGYEDLGSGSEVLCDVRLDYLSLRVVASEPRNGLFDPGSTITFETA